MNTILFDLDGTLLPMEQGAFTQAYFFELVKECAPHGYDDPKAVIAAVWQGTKAMVKNDGRQPNEAVFWDAFAAVLGEEVRALQPILDRFYSQGFHRAKSATSPTPLARQCVDILHDKRYTLVLATNPLFPMAGQLSRVAWAGLSPSDFALITSYENSCHCKPNVAYYHDILRAINKTPQECMMVGNHAQEDMCAREAGLAVWLVTDCLENDGNADISGYPSGSFAAFLEIVKGLPGAK